MKIVRDILSAEIHIRLDEDDFDKLTSGKEIIFDDDGLPGVRVKMILSDIGYEHMISILEKKSDNLHKI